MCATAHVLRDKIEGKGTRQLTADLSGLVNKGNPIAVLNRANTMDTWGMYLNGDADYWRALVALTVVSGDSSTSARTNRNDSCHVALKTKRILLGVKNHNTVQSGLDLAAHQYTEGRLGDITQRGSV